MTALLKQKEKNMNAIQPEDQGYWLLTKGSTLYWQENDLPFGTAKELGLTTQKAMLLGKWKSQPLWLVAENDQDEREYLSLRSLLSLPTEDFHLLSRGVEINHFLKTHQFCGKCGQKAEQTHDELAVQCTSCGYRTYPVICPSIIVAVRREVFEETGIRIKNIRYFGSQPWAFPNSQMVGFLADYDSGEIQLQETELHDAQWFSSAAPLPELPPTGTIALKLINATLELCKAEQNK